MTLLHDAVDEKKYDVRISERHLARGVIKSEDFLKNVSALPDDAQNAEWISVEYLQTLDMKKS